MSPAGRPEIGQRIRDRIDAALDRLATQTAQCSSADHRERVRAQVNEIRNALSELRNALSELPCPHDSLSGDEGPIVELGRMPTRWRCDECGTIIHEVRR